MGLPGSRTTIERVMGLPASRYLFFCTQYFYEYQTNPAGVSVSPGTFQPPQGRYMQLGPIQGPIGRVTGHVVLVGIHVSG